MHFHYNSGQAAVKSSSDQKNREKQFKHLF